MPTIIDSLVIKLGFDTSGMKKGGEAATTELRKVRDSSTTVAKTMEAEGVRAGAFFSSIKLEALSLIGILGGTAGLGEMLSKSANEIARMAREAENIKLPIEDVSAFGNAIARNGGQAEAARNQLYQLGNLLRDWALFKRAPPEFLSAMAAIGGNINDRNPMHVVEAYQKYITTNPSNALQVGGMLGLDRDTVNAMIQVRTMENLTREMQLSRELGVPTKELGALMKELQTSFATFRQLLDGFWYKFEEIVVPHLITSINQVVKNLREPGSITKLKEGEASPHAGEPLYDPNTGNIHLDLNAPFRWLKNLFGAKEAHGGELSAEDRMRYSGGGSAGTYSGRLGAVPGGLNGPAARASYQFWLGKGLTSSQAAGMAAQEMAESNGNPKARGDYVGGVPTAHGAYQWHRARRDRILAGTGIDVSTADIGQQREAAYWELMHVEHRARLMLLQSKGAGEAGSNATEFERPDPNRRAIINAERGRNAMLIQKYNTGPRAPGEDYLVVPNPRDFQSTGGGNNDNSTSLQIDNLNIHTQATDAHGISMDIHRAMGNSLVNQSNSGLR